MEYTETSGLRARVFISCGQNKNSDEILVASQIKEKLFSLGFDPYVAVQEQTLRGLRENLFEQLSKSEYFVFVDFKRELLCESSNIHRGSLFSHQELAIASYLEIPVLAFQELGVKADDGILRIVQLNAIEFTAKDQLPELITKEIDRRKENWNPRWRNDLVLERKPNQYSRTRRQDGKWCRFFQVGVRNRHRRKTAKDCYSYLARVTRLDTNEDIPVRQVEFRWAGYSEPNAHIFAGGVRDFDAFYILEDDPLRLMFNVFATGTNYIPNVSGEGRYELEYAVISEQFPEARASLVLDLNPSLDGTTLVLKEGKQFGDVTRDIGSYNPGAGQFTPAENASRSWPCAFPVRRLATCKRARRPGSRTLLTRLVPLLLIM